MHYARNLLATVPQAHVEMVAAAFRSIFALATKAEVEAHWDEDTDTLAKRFRESSRVDASRARRRAGLHGVPSGALAQDLVQQPPPNT